MDRKSELEAKKAKLEQMRREKAQKNLVYIGSASKQVSYYLNNSILFIRMPSQHSLRRHKLLLTT